MLRHVLVALFHARVQPLQYHGEEPARDEDFFVFVGGMLRFRREVLHAEFPQHIVEVRPVYQIDRRPVFAVKGKQQNNALKIIGVLCLPQAVVLYNQLLHFLFQDIFLRPVTAVKGAAVKSRLLTDLRDLHFFIRGFRA